MGSVFHNHKIELNAPDDSGPYEVNIYVEWDRIQDAVPCKQYGPNAGPAEPAEWQVKTVELS